MHLDNIERFTLQPADSTRTAFCWPCTVRAIVLVVCSFACLANANEERLDPQWAVAVPSITFANSNSPDVETQGLIEGLHELHMPPLLRPLSSRRIAEQAEAQRRSLRYALQPNGVDGWRSARSPIGPDIAAPQADESTLRPADSPVTLPFDNRTLPRVELNFRNSKSDAAHSSPSVDVIASPTKLSPHATIPPNAPATEPPSDETAAEAIDSRTEETEQTPLALAPLPAPKPLPPLTRQLVHLRTRVRSVLNGYYRKTLNSRDHNPWEVMHGMLAYSVQSRVRQGGPRGGPVTAVGWLCYNKPCKGQTLMHVTREGNLRAKYGVGLQGHLGQLLAMLAQCRVSPNYPIRVGNHHFTIHDLIEAEKETCYPKSELTFKLIAFQHYLDLNEKWVNDQGEAWDFPRLVGEELAQPIRGAACGGTHRLSGLSLTVKRRMLRGEPLDGEYARAAEFVNKHHQYAFRLQNRDGSLSTAWFQGRGDESDIDRRIKTTGHILEWLCYSLSDEELRDQRTIRAVSYLANLMYSNYNHEWEVGPVSHATHALLLYDERVFRPYDSPEYAVSYRPKPPGAKGAQGSSSSRRR